MLITGILEKIKFSKFIQTHFSSPKPIRMKKKENAPPGVVCHGLQENNFQVNQLYNVTWSSIQPFIHFQYPQFQCLTSIILNAKHEKRGQQNVFSVYNQNILPTLA